VTAASLALGSDTRAYLETLGSARQLTARLGR
jgi:hypothetical protein